jgi:A/G-specific adenine glycosylase
MNEVTKHISDLCQVGISQSLVAWYAKIKKNYPWRSLWEETKNPWAVWVSEIMLQQTVIAAVLHKYSLFMSRFPTVDCFAAASELEIRPFVSGLGYYRRFFLLHKGSKQVSQHGFPKTHAEWNQISGVGPYTSAAIASITLNEGVGVVDGNVERVLARVFEIKEVVSTPNWKSHFSSIMTFWAKSAENPGDFNQAVMELGQSICSIKNPKCAICPISKHCKAQLSGTQQLCPKPKAPKEYLSTNIKVKIHVKGNQYFLAKRSEKSLFLKGTYGFPFSQIQDPPIDANFLVKHSITKYRISAEICKTSSSPTQSGIWVARDQIEEKLIASLDQKIWKSFQKKYLD